MLGGLLATAEVQTVSVLRTTETEGTETKLPSRPWTCLCTPCSYTRKLTWGPWLNPPGQTDQWARTQPHQGLLSTSGDIPVKALWIKLLFLFPIANSLVQKQNEKGLLSLRCPDWHHLGGGWEDAASLHAVALQVKKHFHCSILVPEAW